MNTWTTALNAITERFTSLFGGLSEEALNWKPDHNTWSIAQNIEHLIVVNETYYPVLSALKEGKYQTPFMAKIGFIVSFLGKTVLNAVKPDRKKKMSTFPLWEPSKSHVSGDILQRFIKHQTELSQKIEDAKVLVEKGTVIASPANKNIVYKLETAFDIIVSHEQRHLEQAKEVLELFKKSSSH